MSHACVHDIAEILLKLCGPAMRPDNEAFPFRDQNATFVRSFVSLFLYVSPSLSSPSLFLSLSLSISPSLHEAHGLLLDTVIFHSFPRYVIMRPIDRIPGILAARLHFREPYSRGGPREAG